MSGDGRQGMFVPGASIEAALREIVWESGN